MLRLDGKLGDLGEDGLGLVFITGAEGARSFSITASMFSPEISVEDFVALEGERVNVSVSDGRAVRLELAIATGR